MPVTLLERHRELKAFPKLNLGSGTRPQPKEEGWINVDWWPGPDVNQVWDLTECPWPVESGTIGAINAHHILEHIEQKYVPYGDRKVDALVAVMNESYRVLATGGRMRVEVPLIHEQGAWQDPTHRRWLVERSMWYFARDAVNVPGTRAYAMEQVKRFLKTKGLNASHYHDWSPEKQTECREEAVKWSFTPEGKPEEWDWNWYHEDIGITARFNILSRTYDPTMGFQEWILEKPWEGSA